MARKSALWPLQVAIFQRLSNDSTVSTMTTGVFDHVPDGQAYPYIKIGEPRKDPFTDKTSYGEELSLVVHTWSTSLGNKQSYDIIEAIESALTQPLLLSGGFSIVQADEPNSTVIDDIDGMKRHGIIRLKFWIK